MKIIALDLKTIILILLIVVVIIIATVSFSNARENINVTKEEYKDFILAFMQPYIYDSLKEHYGYVKNFDLFQTKILKIENHTYQGYYFLIELVVNSYLGAHLEDFQEDKITYRLDENGIREEKFNLKEDVL